MQDDRDPDLLIARALTTYSDVDPDPSLRARITARTSEARPRNPRVWQIAALACAALLCLLIYVFPGPRSPARDISTATAQPTADLVSKRMPHADVIASRAPHPTEATRVPHPKEIRAGLLPGPPQRSRLPRTPPADPAQPSAEERALLELTAEHPEEARRLLAVRTDDDKPLPATPLAFAPVHIAPLPMPAPLHAD